MMGIKKNYRTLSAIKTTVKALAMVGLFCLSCAATYFFTLLFSKPAADAYKGVVKATEIKEMPVIVIDAGHGGVDGGAIAPDGGTEKEINLDVSKRLYELFKFSGVECVMTRTEDKLLADESMKSHRKMTDLKNRLAIVNDIAESGRDVVLVSIHMNSFSMSKYSGLQVWYSLNDEKSQGIAKEVQSYARTWLDSENNREIKKATPSIYLLDRAQTPAILIECGFLSNPEEYARLSDTEYRNKLALIIYAAVCRGVSGG